MKHQPGMAIERGSGVGHFFPLEFVGCSRRWSQPRGTSLLPSLVPLQGVSDGRRIKDKTRTLFPSSLHRHSLQELEIG